MDERQTNITEGAGLEDSRINREFIDLLKKWYPPVLYLVVLVAGAYAGVRYLEQRRITKLDAAFSAFNEAELDRRPDRLIQVASQQKGKGAITELSLLSAADMHLQAYHLRIMPGTLGVDAADRLDDAQAQEMLTKAAGLYADVYEKAKGIEGRELLAIGARWGMAAVALTQKNYDAAEQGLKDVIAIAEPLGFDDLAGDARDLIASFPELRAQREPVNLKPVVSDIPESIAAPETAEEAPAETPDPNSDDPSDG